MVGPSGKVFAFGLGTSGQLGAGSLGNAATPTLVRGNWLRREAVSQLTGGQIMEGGAGGGVVREGEGREGVVVGEVFAGGDQSFARLIISGEQVRKERGRGREGRRKKVYSAIGAVHCVVEYIYFLQAYVHTLCKKHV